MSFWDHANFEDDDALDYVGSLDHLRTRTSGEEAAAIRGRSTDSMYPATRRPRTVGQGANTVGPLTNWHVGKLRSWLDTSGTPSGDGMRSSGLQGINKAIDGTGVGTPIYRSFPS